ncbi:hypothetical protein M4578_06935 [Salipiger sp. P9]|uniref:hypothetical protein n=1 Tax=Salipiger pentaromativorans TaxID=2943193 RepID=UPI0021578A4D|nr:hypothetical protein [Salipiger pentaromativorans]MCR8547558.1 hypothetical protein [Salipiger pentaromativorans]
MKFLILIAALAVAPVAALAEQFNGQKAFEVLTAQKRVYSGGSVSVFNKDGTFWTTHKNGSREEGTYKITSSGTVKVHDQANNRKYNFVIGEKKGTFYFTYRSGPGRGKTYTFY